MLHKDLKPFPDDFFWGASSSAYQVEGAALEDGKGPSCQDVKEIPEGTSDLSVSVDHYHRYKEDIALMAEDRKSTRLNSSHLKLSRMPSSA